MASIIDPSCKYVVVYTDNTTKLQQTLVITSGTTQTLPKNITVNSVTQFGTGCNITTTCGTLPATTVAACYGCNWAINYDGGGISVGMTSFTIKGFMLNNTLYSLINPITIGGGDNSTTTNGLALINSIMNTPNLNSVIQNVCLGNFNQNGSRGADVTLIFKTIPSLMVSSFLYGNYNGGIEPTNITDVYIPIVTFSNLQSGAQTACPCS